MVSSRDATCHRRRQAYGHGARSVLQAVFWTISAMVRASWRREFIAFGVPFERASVYSALPPWDLALNLG